MNLPFLYLEVRSCFIYLNAKQLIWVSEFFLFRENISIVISMNRK